MMRLRHVIGWLEAFLFRSDPKLPGRRAAFALFAALLFCFGALHWTAFFDMGEAGLAWHDWPLQRAYFDVHRQAVAEGVLPWHTDRAFHDTDRFLANPEVALTPQLLLLPHLSPGRFMLANVLLLYAVGFAGCVALARRLRLAPLGFAFFALLFNLNGHVTAHLGMGHPWYGYFLLSWFVLFVLELAEGRTGFGQAGRIALVLFLILIQGSFHIVTWCLLLLGLMVFFSRGLRRTCLLAGLLTGLLGAVRYLPAAVAFGEAPRYRFISGYRSLWDLFEAFVTIREADAFKIGGAFGRMGWWEYDLYTGLTALLVIVFLGVVVRSRKGWALARGRFAALDLPLLVMALLSMSYFYAIVVRLPLPLLNAERAASRFMLVPFLLLLGIASLRIEEGCDKLARYRAWRWLAVPLLAETAFALVNHSVRWSLMLFERKAPQAARRLAAVIANRPDPVYRRLAWLGLAITLATLAALLAFFLAEFARRRNASPPDRGATGLSTRGRG
jgi:hypothetical protein